MSGRKKNSRKASNDEALLTPSEVAKLFRVDSKTVTRWARAGKLPAIRTLGGHRRYHTSDILAFLKDFRGDEEDLLSPSEVAKLFRVDPKTVTRWAKAGKLSAIRTLGGHRRYRASEVLALLDGGTRERGD